jgi:hypothetical protein
MIKSALYLCDALDQVVLIDRHNNTAKTAIKHLRLSKKEWDVLKDLEPILTVCSFGL